MVFQLPLQRFEASEEGSAASLGRLDADVAAGGQDVAMAADLFQRRGLAESGQGYIAFAQLPGMVGAAFCCFIRFAR